MSNSLQTLRSTAAELLALCVLDLFPGAQLLQGQATQDGFYYDFILAQPLDEQAIPLLEECLRGLVKEQRPIKVLEMMRENAAQLFQHHKQPYKAANVLELPSNTVRILEIGKFYDSLSQATVASDSSGGGAIKILSITRYANEDFLQTRITGIADANPQALKKYAKLVEAHKSKDHRLLGTEMELFKSLETAYFWLSKGIFLRETLKFWWQKAVQDQGFKFVKSPGAPSLSPALFFKELCPNQNLLPLRWAEIAEIEKLTTSVPYYGLLDAEGHTADFFSIFCTPAQVQEELISSLQFFDKTLKIFGFEDQWILCATRAPGAAGTRADWDQSVVWLNGALKACGVSCAADLEDNSERIALDGPRLELHIRDALGRNWPLASLSIDWRLPAQHKLRYEENKGTTLTPLFVRGALIGSLDRLVALLLEQHAGQLPFWLAPEQVRVVSIGGRLKSATTAIYAQVQAKGFRVGLDDSDEKLGSKVHAAEREKVPYLVILGDQEHKEGLVTVRFCNTKQPDKRMTVASLLEILTSST